jgi:hypothetical protein
MRDCRIGKTRQDPRAPVLAGKTKSSCTRQDEQKAPKSQVDAQTHKLVISPAYCVELVLPNVISSLFSSSTLVGSRDTATRFCSIFSCSNRLSVTVGITLAL